MTVALILIAAVLAAILLLLLLRIRLILTYRDSFSAELRVLCFRFRLYPRRKKRKLKRYSVKRAARAARKKAKKARRKQAKLQKKKEKHTASTAPATKTGLLQKIRTVRALTALLIRRTHRHLHLHTARLRIRVATDDAAKTAVLYGAVSQSLSYLLFALDKVTRLHSAEPEVAVVADFTAERSAADIRLVFSMRLYGALVTLCSVALAYLKNKLTKGKKRPVHKK